VSSVSKLTELNKAVFSSFSPSGNLRQCNKIKPA
jgi:hypothetical protein